MNSKVQVLDSKSKVSQKGGNIPVTRRGYFNALDDASIFLQFLAKFDIFMAFLLTF